MDAVQRLRRQARKYGYLQANPYCNVVETDGYVEVLPVNPAYIYVLYDPFVVFGPPAPGFFVSLTGPWRSRACGMWAEKKQMIMLCRSMRDSTAEWFHTFASVRPLSRGSSAWEHTRFHDTHFLRHRPFVRVYDEGLTNSVVTRAAEN